MRNCGFPTSAIVFNGCTVQYTVMPAYRRLLKLYGFYVPSVAVKPGLKSGKIRFLKISHYTV